MSARDDMIEKIKRVLGRRGDGADHADDARLVFDAVREMTVEVNLAAANLVREAWNLALSRPGNKIAMPLLIWADLAVRDGDLAKMREVHDLMWSACIEAAARSDEPEVVA